MYSGESWPVENEGVITLKSGELNVMKIVGNQEKKYRKIEIGDVFSEYKGKIIASNIGICSLFIR